MLAPEIQTKVDAYMAGAYDAESKAEIRDLLARGEADQLTDAFYRTLEFGTGGLRGIMGAGLNRMNRYTLGAATQGLCNYLKKSFPGEKIRFALAHDSRINSPEFARVAAGVCSANGFEVFLFEALRPTPELSFAIRHLGCHAGANITASHNPKEYNGYKVYWQDGAQVTAPHDKAIIDEVNAIQSVDEIQFTANPELIHEIGADVDEMYLQMLVGLSVKPEIVHRQSDLKIVYTSLHGAGITLVPSALKRFGFQNVQVVQAQATPDGNFPTVKSPNPEEKAAMQLALDQAQATGADLVLATDPDADRVGVGVKNNRGEWVLLNGNQTASLLVYYLLTSWRDAGRLPGGRREYICNTIVTTDLINEMAEALGVPCYLTLTGFKYIAQIIREREKRGDVYICGGEESYGFLIGQQVRDKDAVSACCLIAELTAVAKDRGQTLQDALVTMYTEFGYRKEDLISLTKKGARGAEEIKEMMRDLRANPPRTIGGSPVVKVLDYLNSVETDLHTSAQTPLDFEKSDVLQFITQDGTKVSARPSGTEPKIKFYFSVRGDLLSAADYDRVGAELDAKIQGIIGEMGLR